MEENHEKKFVCKFCSKRFSCGKALGGHIRTHMNDKSAEAGQEEAKVNRCKIPLSNNNGSSSKRDSGFEAAGQSGYGLRENPKKTRRFADSSNIAFHQEMVCKECGKGFQSLKALCGHMACHSEKEKVTNYKCEDHLGTNEKQKLVMDSQSDTETSTPSRRRSRRMRYKTGGLFSNSVSLANGSSCVSEIEQEQEEVAMCLMMLSRDSSFKKGLHSVADSSDNNSVVLEAKSSSIDVRITIKNGLHCVSGTGKSSEMKKQREGQKLKSAENNLSSSDNSDSGYFRNGPKKVESDVSVDGFVRNVESIKPEILGSGFEDLKAKLGKNLSKFKSVTEFGKDLVGGQADRASAKYDLRKSKRNESCTPEFCSNNAQKKSKINRALGGYGGSHSKTDGYESGENSLETESFVDPTVPGSRIAETSGGKNPTQHKLSGNPNKKSSSKKSKGHECPICFRMFKSGQALGGHKRSHFVGGQEDNTVVIKEELDEMPGLIDLNLPAPVEEEAMEHTGLVPW